MTAYELAVETERRATILRSLSLVYPSPLAEASLLNLLSTNPLTQGQLRESLTYLRNSGLLTLDNPDDPWIARLTAAGVDTVEEADGFDPVRREQERRLRLRVLMMLAIESHLPKTESLLLRMLSDEIELLVNQDNVHRALAYLAGHKLIRLARLPIGPSAMTINTTARINPSGTDYLLGGGPELPGIARPTLLSRLSR